MSEPPEELWSWQSREHIHGSDPLDTSLGAAETAKRVAGPQMRLVFSFLLRAPMTQDQLRAETGLGDNAAKRCSDLKNRGWIKDGGGRAPSNKGHKAVLWEPTIAGRTAFAGGKEPEPRKGVQIDLII